MTVGELRSKLDEYGWDMPVLVTGGSNDDEWRLVDVGTGNRFDEDGANVPHLILLSEMAVV